MLCLHPSAFGGNNARPVRQQAQAVLQNRLQAFTAHINPGALFAKSDADEILGVPSHLSDSSTKLEANALAYRSKHEADTKDGTSEKTGAVYFLFEDFHLTKLAQKKYAEIKKSNERMGIKVIDNLGDEAYYHSDGTNFHFIMVRKGDKVFILKVNKITSTTNLDALKRTAAKIAGSIN